MKQTVEKIVVRFAADMQEWDRAVEEIEKKTKTLAQNLGNIGRSLTKNVTLPLSVIGGLAVREFSKMDQAITQSAAIMSKDVERMGFDNLRKQLTETAQAVGREMPIANEKLGESFYFLASAGFDAEQSMAALPLMAKFATAGMFDMARATDLVTDAQSALGKNTGTVEERMREMERLASNLVEANTLANASVEQFSIALTSKAATAMKVWNIEQEAGLAVLAAYADQGIKAELAGNNYDRVLRLLVKTSLANRDAHRAFGLEVFDATGKMNSMVTITKQLEEGLRGMSKEEAAAALELLGFEARVQQAIFPLIGASEAIAEYEEVLESMTGTVDKVAQRQIKSFNNQMIITMNRVKAVGRDIGRLLIPSFKRMLAIVQSAADFWDGLEESTKKNIVGFAKVAAAAGPVLLVLSNMLIVLPAVIAGYRALTMAAFGTSNAFSILSVSARMLGRAIMSIPVYGWALAGIAGLGLLAAKFVDFSGIVRFFSRDWETVWNDIKIITGNVIKNIGALFIGLWDAFGITIGYFVEHGPAMFAEFFVGVIKVLHKFKEVFSKFAWTLYKIFGTAFDFMWKHLTGFVEAASKAVFKLSVGMVEVFAKLANLDFAGAMETATNVAAGAIVGGYLKVANMAEDVLEELENIGVKIGADFMKNFVTGANTERGGLGEALAGVFDFTDPLEGTAFAGPEFGADDGINQSMDPFFETNPWAMMVDPEAEAAIDEAKDKIAEPIVIPVVFGVDAASAFSTEAFLMQYKQRSERLAIDAKPNKRDKAMSRLENRRDLQREAREDREHREVLNAQLITAVEELGINIQGIISGANIGGTS